MSQKHNVHLYAVVRVKVDGIEAVSHADAMDKARGLSEEALPLLFAGLPNAFRPFSEVEYAEEIDGYLVDEVGDTEHKNSRFYDSQMRLELHPRGSCHGD